MKLGLPAVAIKFLECLNWEVLTIMGGRMNDTSILAYLVIITTFNSCIIMLPVGFAMGEANIIGIALGANRPELAKKNIKIMSVSA
jgi:Na+-driven multidrug efflux pump